MRHIMYAYIIMHNMMIEDEGAAATDWSDEDEPSSSTTMIHEVA